MKLFDSHSHPQDKQYEEDRAELLTRATEAEVAMICVGTDLDMSRKAIQLAEAQPTIWASVGLHPNDNLDEHYDPSVYEELVQHGRVVAVGEIGLDYYRTTDEGKKQFQRERFLEQLELAKTSGKPLIVHCRDAHDDMVSILKDQGSFRGVIHSFTGTIQDARAYIELGFYLGFNGIITFARQYDVIVREVPLHRLLLETDAPYLTPVPYRGKRNEPSYIVEVAKRVAQIRNLSLEEVANVTTKNAEELFQVRL